MRIFFTTALLCYFTTASFGAKDEAEREKILFDFVGNYCLECHDSSLQKGERDFETFELPLASVADLITADEIIDQVVSSRMG